jgi:hypothetical protein
VLMNMELAIDFSRNSGSFIKTNRTWKDRQPIKFLMKNKTRGDGAKKSKKE